MLIARASLLALLLAAPFASGVALAQDEPAAASATETALAAAPGLWAHRDRAGKAQEAITLLEAAVAEQPDNFELYWQLARFHFWLGDTAGSDQLKASHGKTCWDYGIRAAEIDPSAVHGHYWSMACIGIHSEAVGIINAVRNGLAGKYEDAGERAMAIDPNYDTGGPLRALGRFYDLLPWPLRDEDKAYDYLRRAVAVGPEHARNLFFLAELELREDNEAEGRALLERLLAVEEAGNVNLPELRIHKAKARAKLAELDR
jgi:tetratricopeptide (TPR) repeat protein